MGGPREGRLRASSLEYEVAARGAPLVRKRRPARLVQRQLEHAEAKDGALESNGRQRDPELVEELLLRHLGDLGRRLSLDEIAEHRGGRLTDRATATVEADRLDDITVSEPHRDQDLVTAERILALRLRVGWIQQPVI